MGSDLLIREGSLFRTSVYHTLIKKSIFHQAREGSQGLARGEKGKREADFPGGAGTWRKKKDMQ